MKLTNKEMQEIKNMLRKSTLGQSAEIIDFIHYWHKFVICDVETSPEGYGDQYESTCLNGRTIQINFKDKTWKELLSEHVNNIQDLKFHIPLDCCDNMAKLKKWCYSGVTPMSQNALGDIIINEKYDICIIDWDGSYKEILFKACKAALNHNIEETESIFRMNHNVQEGE